MADVLLLGSHKPLPADISAGNWGGKQRGCRLPGKEDVPGSQAYIIYSVQAKGGPWVERDLLF